MKKEYVIEAMKKLPQDFDLDALLEKLVFIEKVEKGLLDLDQGNTVPHEEVREIIKGW
jgi:predicted transcriptional regulator